MANPSADYPSSLHTATDVSALAAQYLGSTSPTHTALEGKQEAELVAVQTKVGTGSSSAALGKVLTGTGAGASAWSTLGTGLVSAKGDLVIGDATALQRLAVGTDGQVLTADAASTLGVKWAAAPTVTGAVLDVTSYGATGDGTTNDTTNVQAAFDAASDGDTVFFPPGDYRLDTITIGGKTVHIWAYGATILQNDNAAVFSFLGTWGTVNPISSITNVTFTESTVSYQTTKLTLTGAPADLAAGDVVKVYSQDPIPTTLKVYNYETIPPTLDPAKCRKMGEFAIVAKLDGNDVYLNNRLRDTYTTTPTVARLDDHTCSVRGCTFTLHASLTPAGDGTESGSTAYCRIRAAINPVVEDVTIIDSNSTAILFHGCYGFVANRVSARNLPAPPTADIARYGYAVCSNASEFGRVTNCQGHRVRHLYTTNSFGKGDYPHNYGRTAYDVIANCLVTGGLTAGFDTHDEAYNITFQGCKHIGGNYRGNDTTLTGQSRVGIQLRGDNCRAVDCEVHNTYDGFYVGATSTRYDDSHAQDCALVNCRVYGVYRRAGTIVRSDGFVIEGGHYENAASGESSVSRLFSITDSEVFMSSARIVDKNNTALASGFYLANTSGQTSYLVVKDCTVDASAVYLNGGGEITNYSFALVDTTNAEEYRVALEGLHITAGARPISGLARHYSITAGNQHCMVRARDITVIADTGQVACADSGTLRDSGLTDNQFFDTFIHANAVAVNLVQYNTALTTTDVTSRYAYYTGTTASLQSTNLIRHKGDDMLVEYVPTADVTLTTIPDGHILGQRMTIRHAGTTYNLTVPHGSNTLIYGNANKVLAGREEITLSWNGTDWVGKP